MYNKDYYDKHKEQWSNYYQKNKPEILQKGIKHYEENKERINQVGAEYYIKNKEKIKEHQRDYYNKNKEKVLNSNKEWAKNNKEEKYLIQKKYDQTENGRLSRQRVKFKRRTKEREYINTLTSQEWLDILEEHNYVCAYCGEEFTCENLPEKDHIIPVSKGGNNVKENILPACRSCNAKKHNKILNKEVILQCLV